MSNDAHLTSYLIVGYGWRAPFFLKPAQLFPDHFRVTGVVARDAEKGAAATERWGVPTWRTLEGALDSETPDFVIASVSWDASPDFVRACVERGIPVLCETPPAPNHDELLRLWNDVGSSGLVQIAEQYPLYPGHLARKAVIASGAIGEVNEAEVSSTHMYHAMAIIREMLEVGHQGATVRAIASTHDLATPMTHAGWAQDASPTPAKTIRALISFEGGKVATYDFTDNQWWNPLRQDRIALRGSLGEIVDLRVTQLTGPRTFVTSHLERRQLGTELNLEGFDLDHISRGAEVLYDNRWKGGRLADDEVAVTELLRRMGDWVRGDAPPPYPLAEGSQDWALALAVEEAAATGETVTMSRQPWAVA
jgi:predicted dehydrogenase